MLGGTCMKRNIFYVLLITLCLLINYSTVYADGVFDGLHEGNIIGEARVSDTSATINGTVIPSLNVEGRIVVFVNDLNNYGFNVVWDDTAKTLEINRDFKKVITPIISAQKGSASIVYSNLQSYIGNKPLLTYNIDGQAAICFEDLAVFGNISWDDKSHILSLGLNNLNYDAKMPVKIRKDSIQLLDKPQSSYRQVYYTDVYFENGMFVQKNNDTPIYNSANTATKRWLFKSDGLYIGTVLKSYNNGQNYYNPKYEEEIRYLSSQKFIDYEKMRNNGIKQNRQIEYENNNYAPLKILKKSVTYNSIGVPVANIRFKNLTDKTVDALEIRIHPYDTYDRRVYNLVGEGTFKGIAQRINIEPSYAAYYTWTLNLFENTSKFNVEVISVHFTDGSVWQL
jgi:hypothetical protein